MSENIKKLSEKDKVRKKISVWLGASNHIAVMHTVKELIGNSVDEINKGNGDNVTIYLHDKKTLTIEDNCQGLPIDGKNADGIENYKLLFETLFAGTKYDNGIENDNYTVGVNGVFNTVLAFSSENVTFEVSRPNGNIYSVSYHKGDVVTPLKIVGKSDKTYTKITYSLDDDIFEENYFTFEELCEIASEQASLIDGSISVISESDSKSVYFKYENGIGDFLDEKTDGLSDINDTIKFTKEIPYELSREGKNVTDNIKISLVAKYTKEVDGGFRAEFLNGSNLIHHGTIHEGFIMGLRNSINRYLRENGLYNKNEKQISKDDVIVGLNYVIDFKSYFPIYANQTKFASEVKYYYLVMKDAIEEYMSSYSIEMKSDMDKISRSILYEKRAREKAEQTRLNVKKKLGGTVSNISSPIDGFVNCKSKDNTKTEYYIVEGKSALGSVQQGRDEQIQAIQALRGKILNCLKASYDRIFKNDVIVDMLKILGCGIEVKSKHAKDLNTFDINNLRWSKIIIATDADVDGYHIRTLILTVLYRLVPTLIEKGYVYIAESPLFEITTKKDESFFAYTDAEKDEIVSKLGSQVESIQRSKGLGENTAEMMWQTTMNPETRRLIQVMPEDAEKTTEVFEMFLGDDPSMRKEYIENHLHEYIEEPLD